MTSRRTLGRCDGLRNRDCDNLATRDWSGYGGVPFLLLCDDCSAKIEANQRRLRALASTPDQSLQDGGNDGNP